jgi:hypothetical protein
MPGQFQRYPSKGSLEALRLRRKRKEKKMSFEFSLERQSEGERENRGELIRLV